jgi:exodeoxyribonuclease VII large subunit
MKTPIFSVSDFVALTNQTLESAYSSVVVEGEVASFKINQGKYVFFDLKDETSSVGCFMMLFQLRFPLEDGMKVVVKATPKLTAWGKFSLTIADMQPSGQGVIKKSFELLKQKLAKEKLFSPERKRSLPENIQRLAVISSKDAAGYADFIKILDDRWGGLVVDVAHVQVQGLGASDQIGRAIRYFNHRSVQYDVLAVIRGGGSQQDLATFNDELLVREIAASKIPVITGIGHEIDETLADLVADVRASTPSNVAQLLTKDKKSELARIKGDMSMMRDLVTSTVTTNLEAVKEQLQALWQQTISRLSDTQQQVTSTLKLLEQLNPETVLKRGYGLVRGELKAGSAIELIMYKKIIQAEVKNVQARIDQ